MTWIRFALLLAWTSFVACGSSTGGGEVLPQDVADVSGTDSSFLTDVFDEVAGDALEADEVDDAAPPPPDLGLDSQDASDVSKDTTDTVETVQAPQKGWQLVWADEFNGPPDPDDPCYDNAKTPPFCLDLYWNRVVCPETIGGVPIHQQLKDLNKCVWAVYDFQNWMDGSRPFGNAINNLDPREVRIEDGDLVLAAAKTEPDGTGWDCGRELPDYYTSKKCPIRSGAVMSNPWKNWDSSVVFPGYARTFGRFEIRARLSEGPGSWPAHWLLPTEGGWPEAGEIDIMEHWQNNPHSYSANYHGGSYDPDTKIRTHYASSMPHNTGDDRYTDGYHVYAVEWEPDNMAFFVDDLEIGRIHQGDSRRAKIEQSSDPDQIGDYVDTTLDIPQIPFFWILNTSVTPFNGGLNSMVEVEAFAGMEHRIDYVRVYERCMTAPSSSDAQCRAEPPRARNVTDQYGLTSYRWSTTFNTLVSGDFNADGADDILLLPTSLLYQPFLLLSDGQGGFGQALPIANDFGMAASHWTDRLAHVADFDGDGHDDVLLQPQSSMADTLLLRGSPGGFETVVVLGDGGTEANAMWSADGHDVTTGDFDGDGRTDLLLVGHTSGHETYLLSACSPPYGFIDTTIVTDRYGLSGESWSKEQHAVHAGDFDGDGHADLILQGLTELDHTFLLRASSEGGFHDAVDATDSFGMTPSLWAGNAQRGLVGDFDGNGRMDLLLQPLGQGGQAFLLDGNASMGLADARNVTTSSGTTATIWNGTANVLHVLDLNGDGVSDLLFQAATELNDSYALLSDQGSFAPLRTITQNWVFSRGIWPDSERELNVGDFNGDGVSDFVLRPRITVGDKQAYLILVDKTLW